MLNLKADTDLKTMLNKSNCSMLDHFNFNIVSRTRRGRTHVILERSNHIC